MQTDAVIGEIMGMVYEIIDSKNIKSEDFENVKKIFLGSGRVYYVLCNAEPYLLVEVTFFSYFSSAAIFSEYLVIGNYCEGVYTINLKDFIVNKRNIEGYFGDFEVSKNVLYILGCENIIAYDKELNELWVSDCLAIDGVVCQGIDGDFMDVSCEMDPPNGWVLRRIDLNNGKIVNNLM